VAASSPSLRSLASSPISGYLCSWLPCLEATKGPLGPASDGLSERWEGPGSGSTAGDSATVTCT
jgi:hypothetical protein